MGIALGGDRIGGQEAALQQIHNFYILNGMIPVSGGFFGAKLGATFWTKDSLDGVNWMKKGSEASRRQLNDLLNTWSFTIKSKVNIYG